MKLRRVVFVTEMPDQRGQMVRSYILDKQTRTIERVREQDGALALVIDGGELRYNWNAVAAYIPDETQSVQAQKK